MENRLRSRVLGGVSCIPASDDTWKISGRECCRLVRENFHICTKSRGGGEERGRGRESEGEAKWREETTSTTAAIKPTHSHTDKEVVQCTICKCFTLIASLKTETGLSRLVTAHIHTCDSRRSSPEYMSGHSLAPVDHLSSWTSKNLKKNGGETLMTSSHNVTQLKPFNVVRGPSQC